MNIFSMLTDKSWLTPGEVDGFVPPSERAKFAPKLALRFFLAVVASLFMLFFMAYITRAQYDDWLPLAEPLRPLADLSQLWLNTFILLASSIAFQTARVGARKENQAATVFGFVVGGFFAIAFLSGQLWLWREFFAAGYFAWSGPATAFFYLLTAVHGLHLLGGLVAWSRTTVRLWRGVSLAKVSNSVELCAIYWHFLFVVWLAVFGMLVSTPETYKAIARFCGFEV